jgi:hypothetical protein
VRRSGLTHAEAKARLAREGPNELPSPTSPAAWRHFAAQMFHFFALMLWIAGVLAFVAELPQLGIAIFVVVIVNGVFAFVQETRAEHAAERLRDLLPRRATVVRDARPEEIDAPELVTDDVPPRPLPRSGPLFDDAAGTQREALRLESPVRPATRTACPFETAEGHTLELVAWAHRTLSALELPADVVPC